MATMEIPQSPIAPQPPPSNSFIKVLLRVPELLFDAYERLAEQVQSKQRLSVEEMMMAQLERFKESNPVDRIVIIDGASRAILERMLGGGQLKNGVDLVKKVEKLTDIKVEGVRIHFTIAQLTELKRRAAQDDRNIEQVLEAIVHQWAREVFWLE